MSQVSIANIVLVGPRPVEIERVIDLADSLGAYESGPGCLVMVDDSPTPRHLDRLVSLPPGIKPVSVHHERRGPFGSFHHGGGLCSCVLLALQWVQANTNAALVVKLDTDSLIIGPFSERLGRFFSARPGLGMAGAYTISPNGDKRIIDFHAETIRRMIRPPFDWRKPLRSLRRDTAGEAPEHIACLIRRALNNGYTPGEHCLGGGYALSRAVLDRMAADGYLHDPYRWTKIDLAEDVMVAAHVRAVGLTLADCVRPGEVFGVRYEGLSETPEKLLEQQYGIIHSVKNDSKLDEAAIRAFFKKQRPAKAPVQSPITAHRFCVTHEITADAF